MPRTDAAQHRAARSSALDELRSVRDPLLARVRRMIKSNDVDENQVAANHLAWTYARVEAADACEAWADATGSDVAHALATAATAEALELLGSKRDPIAVGLLFEAIPPQAAEVVDIGASDEQRVLRRTFRDFARARI